MHTKIQELTDKIYREGIGKAQVDAEKVLNDAIKKAEVIIAEAKAAADKITTDAQANAIDLKKKSETELKQTAQHLVKALQQQVATMINSAAIDANVSAAFADKNFLKSLIETAIKNWNPEKGGLSLILPANGHDDLFDYFKSNASSLVKNGMDVVTEGTFKGGFKLGPADGSYQISFKEDDFKNLYKSYLKPKTIELLFK